jgi:PilZ domain
MPNPAAADADRRRSPRFVCGGQVQISYLPSNGIYLPGRIRDLSLGGCCFDTALPIDCGSRAEIVVHVNAASFRAIGELKSLRGKSVAGMEFVRLSTAGKDMLAELMTHLARVQRLMLQLKSARDMDAEAIRDRLEEGRSRAAMLYEGLPFRTAVLPLEDFNVETKSDQSSQVEEVATPIVVPVDLFG